MRIAKIVLSRRALRLAGSVSLILLIDNYDSFTYNLVHRLGELDSSLKIVVKRNDEISIEQAIELNPKRLIVSPGPCTPKEAGISMECVRAFSGKIPVLGVCLGHQSIGAASSADIVRATHLFHGKTDEIHHRGTGIFRGLPNPMVATRYHSLVIEPGSLNGDYEMTAWTNNEDGTREVMAIEHRKYPVFGVQFHPESFLSESGPALLQNFLDVGPV